MPFRFRSVHWRSGLPLRPEHFHGERFALEERLRWLACHAMPGYGLVPPTPGEAAEPLRVEHRISEDRRTVTVKVVRCLAVAPDGTLMHIDSLTPLESGGTPAVEDQHEIPSESVDQPLHVVLEASGPRTTTFQDSEDSESMGQEWSFPDHRLRFLPQIPAGGQNLLEIARFMVRAGGVDEDQDFLPPCLAIGAHERLVRIAREIAARFRQCHEDALGLCQQMAMAKGRQEPSMPLLATHLAQLGVRCFSRVQDAGLQLSPMELVATSRDFLRSAWGLIDSNPDVRDGIWALHLAGDGGPISDPARFRNVLSDATDSSIEPHTIHTNLASVTTLVTLVCGFASSLRKGHKVSDKVLPPNSLSYQGFTYVQKPYSELVFHDSTKSLEIRGLPALRGGRILVRLDIADEKQRSEAHSIKVGDEAPVTRQRRWPVDMEAHAPSVLIAPEFDPLKSIESLFASSLRVDLNLLSKRNDEDVRVYFCEET